MNLPPLPVHPRLFVPAGYIDRLREQVNRDVASARMFACLRRKADQFCAAPVLARVMEGQRLLAVARSCQERVLTLAMTAHLTGAAHYTRRAIDEMLAAAAFTDWNPAHFLDTAELTLALAIGYDWLYAQLSEQERDIIATAILEKGLGPSLDENENHCWWIKATNNWNQVCHAGMVVGALAVADREPVLAGRIVARALENLPRVGHAYAPDGAYAEGPIYWGYGTSFHIMLIDALEAALGHDYGLGDMPGFMESARYILQVTGPSGRFFNYSDSHEARMFQTALFWFARRLDEPHLVAVELARLDEFLSEYESENPSVCYRLLALALIWHRPKSSDPGPVRPPCHWLGRGMTPLGVHRTAWDDPRATFVALKGGSPRASHGHMDAGTFVLESGGVRWAVDPGVEEYHRVEQQGFKLWDNAQEGQRWQLFRLGTHGHNVPSFDGAQQSVRGNAPVVRFAGGDELAHTVVDLSTIYGDQVRRVWRGMALQPDGSVLLQDEWSAGDMPVEMRWQWLTHARVSMEKEGICLHQQGIRLLLRILPPSPSMRIEVIERSEPLQPIDSPNPGLRSIVLTCRTEAGRSSRLRVLAVSAPGFGLSSPEERALEQWSLPLLR